MRVNFDRVSFYFLLCSLAGLCCFHFFLAFCVHSHVQEIHNEKIKEGQEIEKAKRQETKEAEDDWKTPRERDDTEIDHHMKYKSTNNIFFFFFSFVIKFLQFCV
jgi:hypothetical protein